jgi:DNA-binding response OmpR family regulator
MRCSASLLHTILTDNGFLVEVARTADDALSLIHRSHFDLVILRHASELGIVMVTERDSEREMVQSLEAGADNYVTTRFRGWDTGSAAHRGGYE